MIEYLPARLVAAEGESLSSWLDRVSDANDIPRRLFSATQPRIPLVTLARLLCVDVETLRAMTLQRFPASLVGSASISPSTWRASQHGWICPRCTTDASPRMLAWQLALHPVCASCHCYLTQPDPRVDTDADPAVVRLAAELLAQAEAARHDPRAHDRLARLRQLTSLVALTMDQRWPPRHVPVPEVDPDLFQRWGRSTSPNPLVAANLLAATAVYTHPAHARGLTHEAWERLRPPARSRSTPPQPAWPLQLPDRPDDLGPHWATHDRLRLHRLRAAVAGFSRHHGLTRRHIPATLARPDDYPLPSPMEWMRRGYLSVALLLLLPDEDWPHAIGVHQYLGLAYRRDRTFSAVEQDHGITELDRLILERTLTTLLDDGLIDYEFRRRVFATSRRLPARLRHQLELDGSRPFRPTPRDEVLLEALDADEELLARCWLWIHFTRGTLLSSPFPSALTEVALDYGRNHLEPEQRLALLDHGHELLGQVADDVTHFDRTLPLPREDAR